MNIIVNFLPGECLSSVLLLYVVMWKETFIFSELYKREDPVLMSKHDNCCAYDFIFFIQIW